MSPIYWFCHTGSKIAAKLFYQYEVIHPERLIENGPALIACNHESFFDPPLVSVAFRRPIHFLARKTLFDNRWFGGLIRRLNALPVSQDRPDFTSLKRIIKLLQSGERVLIFPEGERSPDGSLGTGQPGVGLVIAKSNVPVLPMRLFGVYDIFPRHAKRPKLRGKLAIVVGEPIDFSEEIAAGKGKALYQELSDRTLEAIAALELPKGENRG
jgi:1-acyl-sn-glycerol-3-phosphate acyltransferase